MFDRYGPPDVPHPVEMPDPVAGPGEVRIRVRAAGVQPFDCATRRGDFAQYSPLRFPARLGNEAAGVIDQVGDGGAQFAAGQEVIAFMTMLGYADTVVVPAGQAAVKPAAMPWPEAGVLSASGQTADTARIVTIADWTAPARLGIRRIGTNRSAARLTRLTRRYAEGGLTIPVSGTFPLADAADAHREAETGHVRGKIVLTAD